MTNESKSVLAFNLSYLFDRDGAARRGDARHRRAGSRRARSRRRAVTTYPLADVARAHADIESGTTIGKLVLVP